MDDGMLMLIIAVISVTIGYLAGSLLRGGRDHQEEKEPVEPSPPLYPPDALHIWRDSHQNHLVLQIGKRVFQSGEALPPTESKYMAGLLAYLQKWLGIPAPAPQASPQVSQPAQTPATPQVSASPFTPEAPAVEKSIVAQVDDILQEKLFNSPLRDKGVRLMESLDGSMRVLIGLDQYEDIDSIPDENIQAAIRAAVHEWEQRQ